MVEYMKSAASKGAMLTFSWLANNPLTGGDSYNTSCGSISLLKEVVEGGSLNDIYRGWLDDLADLFTSLKVGDNSIPFVFRPFHEMTGKWYWWGTECNTPDEFKRAWNYTRYYLEEVKGVDNALWMFAPSKPSYYSTAYEAYYPGDDRVDIVAFDRYGTNDTYTSSVLEDCELVVNFATKHNKVVAFAETGILNGIQQDGVDKNWFKDQMLQPLIKHCPEISYALTYTNFYDLEFYFTPLPGQETYESFMSFYEDEHSVFLTDDVWQSLDYTGNMVHAAAENGCKSTNDQCGGSSFVGNTDCCDPDALCYEKDETYSQCLTERPSDMTWTANLCVESYSQCGSSAWTSGTTCCDTSFHCFAKDTTYSQCLTECPGDSWDCYFENTSDVKQAKHHAHSS